MFVLLSTSPFSWISFHHKTQTTRSFKNHIFLILTRTKHQIPNLCKSITSQNKTKLLPSKELIRQSKNQSNRSENKSTVQLQASSVQCMQWVHRAAAATWWWTDAAAASLSLHPLPPKYTDIQYKFTYRKIVRGQCTLTYEKQSNI